MPAGTLQRQSTVVGKKKAYTQNRGSGARKYMKKTTKRGAYNKNRKKQFMIRRAPMVETKTKTTEAVTAIWNTVDHMNFISYNSPHAHINPDVFTCWQQGLAEQQIIGKSVFVKYMKRKLTIRFPQPNITMSSGKAGVIPKIPQRYELVWGFVPTPLNLSNNTTPTRETVTLSDINGHINERVAEYFNTRSDRLRYVPKKASNIRIIGRRKVRPDLRFMSTAPPETFDPSFSSTYADGSIPNYETSLYWPMMKKLHLEQSVDLHGGVQGLYPNYAWLPFCTLVSHDWSEIDADDRPEQVCQIAYNDCIWFSDS